MRNAHRPGTAQWMSGFTLIELMVVVAIVAILASIATASYRNSVIKTRRATAAGCLLELSQILERRYTQALRYDVGDVPNNLQCMQELNGFYVIAPAARDMTTYSLTAVPDATRQNDPKCGTLTIDQTGRKQHSGTASSTDECW